MGNMTLGQKARDDEEVTYGARRSSIKIEIPNDIIRTVTKNVIGMSGNAINVDRNDTK
jgi:hypothetical protein